MTCWRTTWPWNPSRRANPLRLHRDRDGLPGPRVPAGLPLPIFPSGPPTRYDLGDGAEQAIRQINDEGSAMMKRRLAHWWALTALVLGLAGAEPGRATAAQLIVNGGFEEGFTGWTVLTQPGSGGNWFTYE